MAARLSADWQQVYGQPIYSLKTFVDPARFRGTCYRAAASVSPSPPTNRPAEGGEAQGPRASLGSSRSPSAGG
jgi:hypothetical protein